ncbi:hypothetical protein ANCCAN_27101, partial [Ancylostoma caninum]
LCFQVRLDSAILDEFFSPTEAVEPEALPPTTAKSVTAEHIELSSISNPDGEDLFGNFANIIGYDLSIDETSLLYH